MKLADYLISVLYGQYQDENDYGDFEGDFTEYLESKGFDDLKRYHLDDNDEMNERLEAIQEMFKKRKENEEKHEQACLEEKDKMLTEIATKMLHMLGKAAKSAKDGITADHDGLKDVKFEKTVGRNAIYLTLRDDDDNVLAEASYKMSRNQLASRYYDFEEEVFTPWATRAIDQKLQDFDSADVEYDTKQFLADYFDFDDETRKASYALDFLAGYNDKATGEETEKPVRRGNQDWDSQPVTDENDDCDDCEDCQDCQDCSDCEDDE